MRVLLIQPPIRDFYRTHRRTAPLGLQYIASSLSAAGHVVEILDALDSGESHATLLPPELAHMAPHYPPGDLSPFRLFTSFRHFGLRFDEIARRAAAFEPHVVGISANFTPYIHESLECARVVRAASPQAILVLGGHHATEAARELAARPEVDFVVCGEGEQTFCRLLGSLEAGTSPTALHGLAFRSEGDVIVTPPADPVDQLDSLPWPSAPPSLFRAMLTSRGCPRRCTFCSIQKVMGLRLRTRDIHAVAAEVAAAVDHGARWIDFEDDNMNWDRNRMLALMSALKPLLHEKAIELSAMNGLVAEKLDEEVLRAMQGAGFRSLNLPLVSGNVDEQNRIHRHQSRDAFEDIVRAAANTGINVTAFIILGLPTDRLDSMTDDIVRLARLPVMIGPSIFYPVPGTPLYALCVEKGYIAANDTRVLRSSAYSVETESFSRSDLVALMRLCRLINYLKVEDAMRPPEGISSAPHPSNPGLLRLTSETRLSRATIGQHLVARFIRDGRLLGLAIRRKRTLPYIYDEIEFAPAKHVEGAIRNFLLSEAVARIES